METTIRTIRLPDAFYRTRRTAGGGEVVDYDAPNLDPNGEARAYVTDGERYGVQYEDGGVDWLGNDPVSAFGEGAEIVEG